MSSREVVRKLFQQVTQHSCKCPAHSQAFGSSIPALHRKSESTVASKEYAFELVTSTIRYGYGVTKEIGQDLVHMKANHVAVFTDKNLMQLPPVSAVLDSLTHSKIQFTLFDKVQIEPSDQSFKEAIEFSRGTNFDALVAVGGGSVMDTAKVANLYSAHRNNDFLDFVNAPIGKGLPVTKSMSPLICVPTTAGTGSETTGTAIFDYKSMKIKTGIASRALRPTLGLIDPAHVMHMPKNIAAFSGFDVLCHALESYTALPYTDRTPCPSDPLLRPAYQGSNPISDIWSLEALRTMKKYFSRSVHDSSDIEARSAMHLASVCAGVGFGNAGVHLPHGMSYPVSGLVKKFISPNYDPHKPLVPHGLSVVLTAPAVFEFLAPLCPERHLKAAELLGADVSRCHLSDAGRILADTIREYMKDMDIPDGLTSLGYSFSDIPALVTGTLPQHRVTKLSPRSFTEEQLAQLFEKSMTIY